MTSRLVLVGAALVAMSLAVGCGSSDAPSPSSTGATTSAVARKASGLLAKDVIGVVCNATHEVIPVTMTSAQQGSKQLKYGNCISSRPQDAGGDSQFNTSLGSSCSVKATVTLPAAGTSASHKAVLGFLNEDAYAGVDTRAATACGSGSDFFNATTPGSTSVIDIGGFPAKLHQLPPAAYAQISVTIFPKGTPDAEVLG